MSDTHKIRYSPDSRICADVKPGRRSLDSTSAGWDSTFLEVVESPSYAEAYDTRTTPDHLLVLLRKGHAKVERYSGRSWKPSVYRPGITSMTAGGNGSRLRWSPLAPSRLESVRIYIAQVFFEEAVEEFRRVGAPHHPEVTDAFSYNDPVVYRTAMSMAQSVSLGAPDLYAETATRFLATHLLSLQDFWRGLNDERRSTQAITDRGIARVLEYMEVNFDKPLSAIELAREAGSSRFHFVKLFRQKVGTTPHRHLIQLRMTAAASMLTTTDMTVAQIASACGMQNAAHFAAAFSRQFSQSPSTFRGSHRFSMEKPTRDRSR